MRNRLFILFSIMAMTLMSCSIEKLQKTVIPPQQSIPNQPLILMDSQDVPTGTELIFYYEGDGEDGYSEVGEDTFVNSFIIPDGRSPLVYLSKVEKDESNPNGGTFISFYYDTDVVPGYSLDDEILGSTIIQNGLNGTDGTNGDDGSTPYITLNRTDDGVIITATNGDDVQSVTVYDGADGSTPEFSYDTTIDGQTTITVTIDGKSESFVVKDGLDGSNGVNWLTPDFTFDDSGDGQTTITVTIGDESKSFIIKDGKDGKNGLSLFKNKCNIWMCHNGDTKVVAVKDILCKLKKGWTLGKCGNCNTCPQ